MKLYNSLPENSRSLLGNIKNISDVELVWEIPENDPLLIALLEKQIQIMIASVANKWFNVGSGIDGKIITVEIPDDRGVIVLPKTEFIRIGDTEIHNHYTTGRFQIIGWNLVKEDCKLFCDSIIKSFYFMLTELHERKMEL